MTTWGSASTGKRARIIRRISDRGKAGMYYAAQTEPEKPSGLTVEYDQERGKVCITAPGCTVTYDSSTGNVEISGLGMVEYQNEKVTIGG